MKFIKKKYNAEMINNAELKEVYKLLESVEKVDDVVKKRLENEEYKELSEYPVKAGHLEALLELSFGALEYFLSLNKQYLDLESEEE